MPPRQCICGPTANMSLSDALDAHLACQLRIADASAIAHAHHEAARGVCAHMLYQLLAQRTQCFGMHQQHALVIQPDPAVAGGKVQAPHQIDQIGEAHLVDLGIAGVEDRAVAMRQWRGWRNAGGYARFGRSRVLGGCGFRVQGSASVKRKYWVFMVVSIEAAFWWLVCRGASHAIFPGCWGG